MRNRILSIVRDAYNSLRESILRHDDPQDITLDTELADLRLGQIELACIAMAVEDEFNITIADREIYRWQRVADIAASVEKRAA